MLVNRAALNRYAVPNGGDGLVESRCAVDDEECGPPQPALDEIVDDAAPSLGALAAHALDREQHLLAVVAYAEDDEQLALRSSRTRTTVPSRMSRTIGSSASERAFQALALHLAPRPAHRVLADRSAEQGRECPADPARIGAGQVAAGISASAANVRR